MERRRVPYERERWLSAVLIVVAIAGASLAVPRWPLAVGPSPRVVHPLPARTLPLIDLPAILTPTPARIAHAVRRGIEVAPPRATAPTVAVPAPERASSSEMAAVPATREASANTVDEPPLLASRRVDLAGEWPSPADPEAIASSSLPLALIEIPAVAVTRAVIVAGRGIRTGLRATSAMLRAAF